jgi:cysteine desulfurase
MRSAEPLIYLDHAATTPVAPEVREAMAPFLGPEWGNPAAVYSLGRTAEKAVEAARGEVASLIGAGEEEIVFTSGGTESDNWTLQAAVRGRKRHLVVSAVEHHAVLATCEALEGMDLGVEVTRLGVDRYGRTSPDALREALGDETALVSIMHANNEIGTVNPIAELAAVAHQRGALFHTDAVQSAGKIPVDVAALGVDFLSISAHKMYGPKGVGALYRRRGAELGPLLHGGGQEGGLRSGTVNVAGVVGFGRAAALAEAALPADPARQRALLQRLWSGLREALPGAIRHGHPEACLPNILNISIRGMESETMLMYLDARHGICASSASACSTGTLGPSHVLLAIGADEEEATATLRFSLGRATTAAEIDATVKAVPAELARLCGHPAKG